MSDLLHDVCTDFKSGAKLGIHCACRIQATLYGHHKISCSVNQLPTMISIMETLCEVNTLWLESHYSRVLDNL